MIANVVIIFIAVVAIFFAIKSSVAHFKGNSSCCGGGAGETLLVEKTLDAPIIEEKTIQIQGMTCQNCRARVQNSLNKIDGLCANVDLKKENAILKMARNVSNDEIKSAVERAGYTCNF